MGKGDILAEISSLKKMVESLDKKVDRVIKEQKVLKKEVDKLSDLYRILETFPAKLNTTSFQITSRLEENVNKITKDFEKSLEESMSKMDRLVDINHRLDVFEEDMKAYMAKIRVMLMELEDDIKRR